MTKGWSVISTESLPRLVFTVAIFCHKNPEAATTLEKSLFLDAFRQTTRQRSRTVTTALARVHRLHRLVSYHLMVHYYCPSALSSRQLYENLVFRGSVPTGSNEKETVSVPSEKKKLVWFCEWAKIFMSCCSWNFFSKSFCEMHVSGNSEDCGPFQIMLIFSVQQVNKIRCRSSLWWDHEPFTQKTEGVAEKKFER